MKKIIIMNDCILGENVKIYDHNHIYSNSNLPIRKQGFKSEQIIINRNCWIGSNVVILKGVEIGENCIIGAGCVIYRSIPAGSVVVSNNGRILEKKFRIDDRY